MLHFLLTSYEMAGLADNTLRKIFNQLWCAIHCPRDVAETLCFKTSHKTVSAVSGLNDNYLYQKSDCWSYHI